MKFAITYRNICATDIVYFNPKEFAAAGQLSLVNLLNIEIFCSKVMLVVHNFWCKTMLLWLSLFFFLISLVKTNSVGKQESFLSRANSVLASKY